MRFISNTLVIFRKDLLLEFRSKEALSIMVFLSLLLLVVFNFAIDIDRNNVSELAPGILWVIFSFSGILGMGRTSAQERQEDAYMSVLFSPASAESLYLGKVLSNLVFLLIMEAFTIVLFAVFFDYEKILISLPSLLPPLLLGSIGFAVTGTIFSFISTGSEYGEIILPLLFLPVVTPVILGSVSATKIVLTGGIIESAAKWLKVLLVFDILYLCLALLLFRHLLEE